MAWRWSDLVHAAGESRRVYIYTRERENGKEGSEYTEEVREQRSLTTQREKERKRRLESCGVASKSWDS